jgi:TusA-related sulfurtransferase
VIDLVDIVIDSKGLACPGPITELIKAYKKAKNGDRIILYATDPGVKADSKAWCERTKNKLANIEEENGVFKVTIEIINKK